MNCKNIQYFIFYIPGSCRTVIYETAIRVQSFGTKSSATILYKIFIFNFICRALIFVSPFWGWNMIVLISHNALATSDRDISY